MGAKAMEALIRFLEQVLGDGQIDQGGVDVFVAQIGGQIVEAFLGLNARTIPRQHAVDDKGVAQVMEPRSPASWLRLQAGPSNDIGQQMPEGDQRVALAFVLIPEEQGTPVCAAISFVSVWRLVRRRRQTATPPLPGCQATLG